MKISKEDITFEIDFVDSLFVFYAVVNSLFMPEKIGPFSILILVIYLLKTVSKDKKQNILYFLSFIFLAFAVILFILDVTDTFTIPIRKLSEWSFFLMFLATLRILIADLIKVSKIKD